MGSRRAGAARDAEASAAREEGAWPMTPDAWRKDEAKNRKEAREASMSLSAALKGTGARVHMMDGAPGLPDMVFPANSAVVLNGRALISRFRYHERQGEERHFLDEFARLKDELLAQFAEGCGLERAIEERLETVGT